MSRAISLHLGEEGRQLGLLRYDQQGARESSAFQYDAAWLTAVDRFAIEPGLPLVAGPQFHRRTRDGSVFHAAIADTEPDGWGKQVILRDHAKRRQEARRAGQEVDIAPLNALDYLLAVDDVARVGALRLQDEDGRYQVTLPYAAPEGTWTVRLTSIQPTATLELVDQTALPGHSDDDRRAGAARHLPGDRRRRAADPAEVLGEILGGVPHRRVRIG